MPDDKTALQAVEEAAGAMDDSSSSEEPSQPADGSPPIEEGSEGSSVEAGPIPVDRHKAILEKARGETNSLREELESYRNQLETYKKNYEWAENFDRQGYERNVALLQQIDQDPLGFYQRFTRELESHPHLGPQFKTIQPRELPKPSLRSEDGKSAYTAEEAQALVDHHVEQVKAGLAQEFQQLRSELQSVQQEQQQRQRVEEAQRFSQSIMAEAQSLEGFKEHEKDIQKALAEIPSEELRRDGIKAAFYKAYLKVYHSKIQPKSKQSAESQVVETLKKKAAATTVDPSGTTAAAKRPKNRKELAKFLEASVR